MMSRSPLPRLAGDPLTQDRPGAPWTQSAVVPGPTETHGTAHRCPGGLWASPRPGWAADSASWGSPTTPDTFSSSRRFKQAALGFRLRSGGSGGGERGGRRSLGGDREGWDCAEATPGQQQAGAEQDGAGAAYLAPAAPGPG